jgi:hypothetical protein
VIAKELRALLPVWAAAAGAVLTPALVRELRPFGLPAYFIGAVALGALSVGHEYSHRTLALTLTLPISRRRILVTKLAALGLLLVALAMVGMLSVSIGRREAVFGQALVWLPILAGLFITPYLTMATRSPIAGAVFTLGIAGVLTIGGEWIGVLKYGYTGNVDSFRVAFLWRALLVLSAASAALMWWTFPRLQVLDGPGAAIDLVQPAVTSSAVLTKRNPIWVLIKKELRLQQLAFVIAAVYAAVHIVVATRTRGMFLAIDAATVVALMYAGVLALLVGAVASAEERGLRTLDAQLLLPMGASRQWLIKSATVLGLALVLAILLPAALAAVFPPEPIVWARTLKSMVAIRSVVTVLAMTVIGLYVSTLCSSGVWALMLSVPAGFAVAGFVMKLGLFVQRSLYRLDVPPDWRVVNWSAVLVTIGVLALVLRLAFDNHRRVDRSRWRIAGQIAIVAAVMVVGATLVGIAGALSR